MTPILIFFSWASAATDIPSTAMAADSPTSRRAALCPGMVTSPGLYFVQCAFYSCWHPSHWSRDQMSSALLAATSRRRPLLRSERATQGYALRRRAAFGADDAELARIGTAEAEHRERFIGGVGA